MSSSLNTSRSFIARYRTWAQNNIDVAILPVLMIAVVVVFCIITAGSGRFFLSFTNLTTIASQIPILGLLSIAMMITMVTGGINLSTISTMNFTAVVMALMLTFLFPQDAPPILAALASIGIIVAGLAFSLLLGLVNGVLVAYVKVTPVLTTLGTMLFYEGLTLSITKGFVISNFPPAFLTIGTGALLGIPYTFLIFIAVAIVMSIVMSKSSFGKKLYMLGSNSVATQFSGISTSRILLKTYLTSGLLCGIAAVISVSRFNSANARGGASFLLLTVLISVLGGTDPFGGFGKISGLVFALLILQFLSSGLNLLGMSPFVAVSIWGIMLVAVIAYRFFHAQHRDLASSAAIDTAP